MAYFTGTITDYSKFVQAFHSISGLDLNFYKENQMKRRILNFMSQRGYQENYTDFIRNLNQDQVLYDAFFKHLTINVTQFFRDVKQWDIFRETIIPTLLKSRSSLRIWSAGCSAGQEACTMGIILTEYFPNVNYSIVGSDIDTNVLKQAQCGVYDEKDFASTPPKLIDKYFTVQNKRYQISQNIAKNITYKMQNLLTDRFERSFDLIACRNVVIYFTDDAKDTLYKKFTDSLNPGGILFTGSTEHLFSKGQLGLNTVSSFFYQK
ncbi:protein-glutamate O-methyltransferase CheR [Dehalobacter sp. DCM]|uniref:CheR family methyltransferase n=1 Tax=Dehalobacter sp. DCM TaxID=2907827 RepID=UPI0030819A48|nr:protein-glutamate O-methyltransferase CheR [Dehalobacter sp. DCM]